MESQSDWPGSKDNSPSALASDIKNGNERDSETVHEIVPLAFEVMLNGGCSAGATVSVYGAFPFLGVRLMSVHCLWASCFSRHWRNEAAGTHGVREPKAGQGPGVVCRHDVQLC